MLKTKAVIAYVFFGILATGALAGVMWAIDKTGLTFLPAFGVFVGSLLGVAIASAVAYLILKTLFQWIIDYRNNK